MFEEIWKPIHGFEDYYEVSNKGCVRSLSRLVKCSRGKNFRIWKGKILSNILSAKGYYQVSLSVEGETHKVYVHRLVAETFLEDRNETVNHKDGNKLNNCLFNLEWVSYSYNNSHAYTLGLKFPSGGRSKIYEN